MLDQLEKPTRADRLRREQNEIESATSHRREIEVVGQERIRSEQELEVLATFGRGRIGRAPRSATLFAKLLALYGISPRITESGSSVGADLATDLLQENLNLRRQLREAHAEVRSAHTLIADLRNRLHVVSSAQQSRHPDTSVDDSVTQISSKEQLIHLLEQTDNKDAWWLDHVCTRPVELTRAFESIPTAEIFFEAILENLSATAVDLELEIDPETRIQESDIVLMALYPSRAVRSLSATVARNGLRLHSTIDDSFFWLDPNADQSENRLPGFLARVVIFGIACE